MSFSLFAKTLYPIIGNGQNKSDFVLSLVNEIMDEPMTDQDKALEDNNLYNPLEKYAPNTLEAYFSGKRRISEKSASAIIMRLNPNRFKEYLLGFNENVINMLREAWKRELTSDDVVSFCTDFFSTILKDCAKVGDVLTENSTSTSEPISVQIERLKDDNVFSEGHKIYKLAENDTLVANRLRDLFTQHDSGCIIEHYIREDIGERIEEETTDLSEDSINDIYGFFQTVYESCLENETHEDTLTLFYMLNSYLDVPLYDVSSGSLGKISELRNMIIALLDELDVLN